MKTLQNGTNQKRTAKKTWLLGLWSFFEANFWFIAPDFLLIIFGIEDPKGWKRRTVLTLATSLLGGLTYYALLNLFPVWCEAQLARTPFVTPHMLAFVEGVYQKYNYVGVLFQSFSFMSFKIWTFQAVKFNFSPWIYFPLVMGSRLIRLGAVSWLAARLSKYIRPFAAKRPVLSIILYTIIFVSLLIVMEG